MMIYDVDEDDEAVLIHDALCTMAVAIVPHHCESISMELDRSWTKYPQILELILLPVPRRQPRLRY